MKEERMIGAALFGLQKRGEKLEKDHAKKINVALVLLIGLSMGFFIAHPIVIGLCIGLTLYSAITSIPKSQKKPALPKIAPVVSSAPQSFSRPSNTATLVTHLDRVPKPQVDQAKAAKKAATGTKPTLTGKSVHSKAQPALSVFKNVVSTAGPTVTAGLTAASAAAVMSAAAAAA